MRLLIVNSLSGPEVRSEVCRNIFLECIFSLGSKDDPGLSSA